jgi:TIR domain
MSTERPMMSRIFINFRNGDGEWAAEALRVVLEQRFGKDHVFLSHESIPIGEQWPDALLDNARTCDVFLALIGPKWLSIKGADGRPRIFGEHDWVRREIAAALAADRTVAPILLGDTPRLDPATDLPADIRDLARKQGPRLDVRQFDDNYAGLERKLMEIVPGLRPRLPRAGIRVNSDVEVEEMDKSEAVIAQVPEGADGLEVTSKWRSHRWTDSSYNALKMGERDWGKGDRG